MMLEQSKKKNPDYKLPENPEKFLQILHDATT